MKDKEYKKYQGKNKMNYNQISRKMYKTLGDGLEVLSNVRLGEIPRIVGAYQEHFRDKRVIITPLVFSFYAQENCAESYPNEVLKMTLSASHPEECAEYYPNGILDDGKSEFRFHEYLKIFTPEEIAIVLAHEGMEWYMHNVRHSIPDTNERIKFNHRHATSFDRRISRRLFAHPYARERINERLSKEFKLTEI